MDSKCCKGAKLVECEKGTRIPEIDETLFKRKVYVCSRCNTIYKPEEVEKKEEK
jgi:hypothetical protein